MDPSVLAVSASAAHTFSKPNRQSISLVAGEGVEGDAHSGRLVKHRYLVGKDKTQPNLRQVHLIHSELFGELATQGHSVAAGELGENITTRDVDLLALPTGTVLHIGSDVAIELTGLRNPCGQIDDFQEGLVQRLRYRDDDGGIVRIAGVMGVILTGGLVRPGDMVVVERPAEPHVPLVYVADSHKPPVVPGLRR